MFILFIYLSIYLFIFVDIFFSILQSPFLSGLRLGGGGGLCVGVVGVSGDSCYGCGLYSESDC